MTVAVHTELKSNSTGPFPWVAVGSAIGATVLILAVSIVVAALIVSRRKKEPHIYRGTSFNFLMGLDSHHATEEGLYNNDSSVEARNSMARYSLTGIEVGKHLGGGNFGRSSAR
jgi:hypothetical protein